jgi:hypothetical protein
LPSRNIPRSIRWCSSFGNRQSCSRSPLRRNESLRCPLLIFSFSVSCRFSE